VRREKVGGDTGSESDWVAELARINVERHNDMEARAAPRLYFEKRIRNTVPVRLALRAAKLIREQPMVAASPQ